MTPIREQIIQKIMSRLSVLGSNDVLRRETYSDEERFVCVWDDIQETEKLQYGVSQHTMNVMVEYMVDSSAPSVASGATATGMYAEVIAAIYLNADEQIDTSLDGLVEHLNETSFQPFTPESGLKVTGAGVSFEVIYQTKTGNPFEKP